MMLKSDVLVSMFLCGALLSLPTSYASERTQPDNVQPFPKGGDDELRAAVSVDKSKTATSSLKIPTLQEESRHRKALSSIRRTKGHLMRPKRRHGVH